MYKIILFDLGNVLAKPIDDYKLYSRLNCRVSYEDFLEYWWYDELVIKAHKGLVSDEDHIRGLLSFCNSDLTVQEFLSIYRNLDNSFYSDMVEYIGNLKREGYSVGILSNLRLMDFSRYRESINQIKFDYLFFSYEMKAIKPSKEIYLQVINTLKCEPNDIIFFDDSLENVNAARDMEINAYQINRAGIRDTTILSKILDQYIKECSE